MKDLNIKHPIVQFFLVGLLLFGLNYVFTGKSTSENELVITDTDLENGIKKYLSTWGEYPDSIMLLSILDQEIEQEVLFQKGLELQLDKNNQSIKEQLVLSTREYLISQADLSDPGDSVLLAYMNNHKQKFIVPTRYNFDQFFFENNKASALASKKDLERGIPVKSRVSKNLAGNYKVSQTEIIQNFGKEFAGSLKGMKTGESAVIKSIWGWHLVSLNDISDESLMDYQQNREMVLNSWREEEQNDYYRSVLNDLKKDVKVAIDIDSLQFLNTP